MKSEWRCANCSSAAHVYYALQTDSSSECIQIVTSLIQASAFPGQDKWLQLDRALSPVAEHLEAQGFLARRPGSGSDSAARAREHSA